MVVNKELVSFWNTRDTGATDSSGVPLLGIALVVGAVILYNVYDSNVKNPKHSRREKDKAAKSFGLSRAEFDRIYSHK